LATEAAGSRAAERDLALFNAHCGTHSFAIAMASLFTGVFLLKQGMSPAGVFLVLGAVLAVRFILRPLALWSAPRLGLVRTLAFGCLLYAGQYLLLAQVKGLDFWLVLYCLSSGFSNVFYWTTFHALFAALADARHMGKQVGLRQLLATAASVAGPVVSGLLLTLYGPLVAFGVAAAIMLVSIAPLIGVREPGLARETPANAFASAKDGAIMFSTDGFIGNAAGTGWGIACFQTLGERFDSFGWLMAAAALTGAVGGLALGRGIDLGHGRRAVALNAALGVALFAAQAFGAGTAASVTSLSIVGTLWGALYLPSLMAVVYRAAKSAPCVFRFHFVLEGGWDLGGMAGCLAGAGLSALGAPVATTTLLAIPVLLGQAAMLARAHPRGA
jgi:DHA1 family inner membrane transport protein